MREHALGDDEPGRHRHYAGAAPEEGASTGGCGSRADRASVLWDLSEQHAATVMLGVRCATALPTTFGLKTAGWVRGCDPELAPARCCMAGCVNRSAGRRGGDASGARRALGRHHASLRAELDLRRRRPGSRSRSARRCSRGSGLYAAALGKIARDLSLLMQFEVGEVAEPGGGSSTLPQKQNFPASVIALAAATRMPGLVASFLTGIPQEHERRGGRSAGRVADGRRRHTDDGRRGRRTGGSDRRLSVDRDWTRESSATRGTIFAESARCRCSRATCAARRRSSSSPRRTARSRETGITFAAALQSMPEVRALPGDVLAGLDDPEQHLGDAERLRRVLVADQVDSVKAIRWRSTVAVVHIASMVTSAIR